MIFVVGGTGLLGGRVVRLLNAGGQRVRCLVRAGTDNHQFRGPSVDVVVGDLAVPSSLKAACEGGVQTVVATATPVGRRLAGAPGPSVHDVGQVGMAGLIAAAEDAGVERFTPRAASLFIQGQALALK